MVASGHPAGDDSKDGFGSARSIRISRKPQFAVAKFQRKLNGCCGTEVKTYRSVGGRPWNVECLSNT